MTSPLCYLPNGQLLCYDKSGFFLMQDGVVVHRLCFSSSFIERCQLLNRVLRKGVRASLAIDNNSVVLSYGQTLKELDLQSGLMSKGWGCDNAIRPLMFTNVTNVEGFSNGIYFGGYLQNKEKKPVSIYHRVGVDQWDVVYTFPCGAINHVHNIIPDPYRQCLWILTGDFGDSAAIWKVTEGFNKVERFVYGNQKWRGCVAFAIPEGILYATDTPFDSNHIYLLREDRSIEMLGDLCGSCIYGCQWNNSFVFSSTVEADGRDETLMKLMFSKKRGSGIIDDYVRIYMGNLNKGFKEIYKEKKDFLPFIFQFGAFKFPSGINNSNTLYFQPVATNKNSMKLMDINWNALLENE